MTGTRWKRIAGGMAVLLFAAALSGCAGRAEIFIGAADLAAMAPSSDTPTPGKWWLKRDAASWGVPGGAILMTGDPGQKPDDPASPLKSFTTQMVPPVEVAPHATGWHRIYVGLYADRKGRRGLLWARLSGEPYPEYLQTPDSAEGKVCEVCWKAADLTGKSLRFEQVPAPMRLPGGGYIAGIAHVRLAPMSAEDVAAAREEIELPPFPQRLFGILDVTSEIFWRGTARTEEDIRAIVYRHQQAGFGLIYWRCFGTFLDNSAALPEAAARWTGQDEARWRKQMGSDAGWADYIELSRRFDPLKVAVEYGRRIGVDVHACVRFADFNREPYANFWHEHPEFLAQDLVYRTDPATSKLVPVVPYQYVPWKRILSFAHPEVRAFYVRFFKQIASTGVKGIMIDLLRHPPIAGYEPIAADAFRAKYGIAMEDLDARRDPRVQEFFSQYLHQFLVDLRKEIGNDIEISVRCSGPDQFALRGKEWIQEGLINAIIDGNWNSGNAPRATIAQTIEAAGARGKALAVAETVEVVPEDHWREIPGRALSPRSILSLAAYYSGLGVSRFGLYESTFFVYNPEARRAIRQAGWAYDPSKNR